MQNRLQCAECKHFDRAAAVAADGPYRCNAFDVIPEAILLSEHDHRKPYPGDHGIHFEPKNEEPANG